MSTRPPGAARAVVASYVGVVGFAGVVFLAAGRLAAPTAWVYVALAVAGTTLNHLLVPAGSTLTTDRARDARQGEAWDRKLLGASLLATVAAFVTAGLDLRFGWTGPVPLAVTATGAVAMLAGQALFAVAKRENAFFSSTVGLWADRGHRVCDTGPYLLVRHPGYLGLLVAGLAFPAVLGSVPAVVPALAQAAVLVVRTAWEDAFLHERLDGYAAYAARTRSRLVPGVW